VRNQALLALISDASVVGLAKPRRHVAPLRVCVSPSGSDHSWEDGTATTNTFQERLHNVEVERVLQAFDHGDSVEMHFETVHGTVSGGQLLRKILPDGSETIRQDRGGPGRSYPDCSMNSRFNADSFSL
jgi:hypothetical protein